MDSSISGSGVIGRMRFRMENGMQGQIKSIFKVLMVFLFGFFLVCTTHIYGHVCVQYALKIADNDDIVWAIHKKVGNKVDYRMKAVSKTEINQYYYRINDNQDKNILSDMIDAVNDELAETDISKKVALVIEEEWDIQSVSTNVLRLSNYNENIMGLYSTSDDSQCQYLYYLTIYGNDGSESSLYNQPSSYPALEGIEYLRVIDKVNKNAEEEGIDWYEVFPDLKGYEVYQYENGESTIIYQETKDDEVSENYEETEAP